MTIAVCIRCGALKVGGLSACHECGFEPEENEDMARSMVLTDHHLPEEELRRVSERIKTGQPVQCPEGLVAEYTKGFEQNPDILKLPLWLRIGCASLEIACVAAILGGIALVVWLLIGNR